MYTIQYTLYLHTHSYTSLNLTSKQTDGRNLTGQPSIVRLPEQVDQLGVEVGVLGQRVEYDVHGAAEEEASVYVYVYNCIVSKSAYAV